MVLPSLRCCPDVRSQPELTNVLVISWLAVYESACSIHALQTLFFGISADASGQSLLEEYIFNFDFSDGGARLDLTTDGKKFSSSKAAAGQVMTRTTSRVTSSMLHVSTGCHAGWTLPDLWCTRCARLGCHCCAPVSTAYNS